MTKLEGLSIPQLVGLIDQAREEQDEAEVQRIEAWLRANFKPQRIVGRMG